MGRLCARFAVFGGHAIVVGATQTPGIAPLAAQGAGWQAFRTLYPALFPRAQREPVTRVRARLQAGRYRLAGAWQGGALIGFCLLDVVPQPRYGVLTFLGVDPGWRGCGLGAALVADAVAAYPKDADGCLLVEAEPSAVGLYRRCGFRALALDYRVPAFHGTGERALTLMRHGGGTLPGAWLRAVIGHMFTDGYQRAADDAGLAVQRARIPERVEVRTC